MRSIILVLFTVLFCSFIPRQDSAVSRARDTTRLAADTSPVKPMADTLSAAIRMPDSTRHNRFIDTLLARYAFNPYQFNDHALHKPHLRMGKERPSRDTWIIGVILILLVYTGLLNRLMGKDIYNVVRAFYAKSSLAKLNREDSLLTSWAFICLFSLFGFTLGLYVYQVILFNHIYYSITGFQLFIACSLLIIALLVIKILILRILGFIFDIGKLIGEYVSILYLTYFNVAFIFLPVVICFSLFPSAFIPVLLDISIVIICAVVLIQYVRSIFNIISNFTFHKIYLFVYLCALEICPILIIIKALNL